MGLEGCIEFTDENQDTFESTVCGQIASYYYMSYKTMGIFKQSLKSDCSIIELIRILSSATEYDELPVRHNEDKLNFALSKEVPFDTSDLAMDEPSTKAILLFQAHFSRLQLPITDYVTDLRSVLDQSIRILQAMLDYTSSSDHAWLQCTLKIVNLIQMITQGRWLNDSTIANLPNITEKSVMNLWKNGIETLPELMACHSEKIKNILKEDEELTPEDISSIIKTIRFKYPRIDVQVTLSAFEIGLDSDLLVLCRLRRYSGNPNKIYSPKWYKPKLEGWIIVIALHSSNKLLAMKRCRVQTQWRTTKIKVTTPANSSDIPDYDEEKKKILFDVYIMSDAYLGLDQFYTISCNLDILQQPREIGGFGRSKFEAAAKTKRRLYDDDTSSIASSTLLSERMEENDPFLNIETTNDLIGLKQEVNGNNNDEKSLLKGGSYAQSVLSGATFDTSLLDLRNRPESMEFVDANSIQIDFDDLRSVVTDITDNDEDARSILTQATSIKKWD